MTSIGDLRTGFTGDVERKDSLGERASGLAQATKDEIGAVAAHAQDHPSATAASALTIAVLAFAAGYLLGQSRRDDRIYERFW
ncbi:hypothetical protein BJF93_00590 [Xaviernesmea oryzae]|uniref:Uncharacterized protein n=1 Tax=Xaviernesmea oryzae TaxID=464029 RepID=A0A1Q9B0G0_9HYPH|nr:hypothetical protein [Xaviernesmea oryzae]OLP61466.1 hypothetical protein BJF93_00590 [Xaviernesmea oryzae]SEL68434.1 hypothetical protein SAMN04487976_11169 [Xaviernesmea oryzae]